jgi:hypothetical protein
MFANFIATTLNGSVSIGASSISVVAPAAPFNPPPDPGGEVETLILADDPDAPSKFEVITYTGRTGSGPYTLTGVSKGQEGTSDQAWSSGSHVGQFVTAAVMERAMRESIVIACSDEDTDLSTGTAKVTFRMPYAFYVEEVRASVNTAPTGSTLTVDINEGGVSILSTVLSIDAGEETSETAATAAVISDASLADDAEITIDIDQVGSTVAGKGLKVTLKGYRTA